MELSPEEKKRIYEEEKARIEAEKQTAAKKPAAEGGSTTKLSPNKAGFLCYVGFWVTGIIFLIIERKNRLVRFHAMQSLVVFGILNIIWGTATSFSWGIWGWGYWGGWYGYPGHVFVSPGAIAGTVIFGIFFAFWWILWAVLMYRTYHGRLYKVPWFGLGNLAEKCLARLDAKK
jgi:uncharacterized membrane protein